MNEFESRACASIQCGDVETLSRILDEQPDLPNARIDGARTLLHVATDWPGRFPNSGASITALIEHGADVNARFIGRHSETPLHWAASSNDVVALDVLLDRGADIEADGGVIGGGTPLSNAVAFGQWEGARRLIERGAIANLWQAAAMGLMSRLEALTAQEPAPEEITKAFWCACHGGQQQAAEYLLARGADANWIGWDRLSPLDAASRSGGYALVEWLRGIGARPAKAGASG